MGEGEEIGGGGLPRAALVSRLPWATIMASLRDFGLAQKPQLEWPRKGAEGSRDGLRRRLIGTEFIHLPGEVNRRTPGTATLNVFAPFVSLRGYLGFRPCA